MARSDFTTIIPLDRAARVLGVDPYHFNTIYTSRRPEKNAADDIWFQRAEQRIGQAGRDDLASALNQAERRVIQLLGYSPVPIWIKSEEHIVIKPYAVNLRNLNSLNSRGQYKSIRSNLGYVVEAGLKAKTLIQAGAAVVYSDDNGDGYSELATVTVATALTEAQEIHAYFAGKSGDDRWEIRPIDVSISGGNATITFQKYLVPDPELWEQDPSDSDPEWRAIDGDVSGNFVTTVDVYRVYTDPSQHATFYHENTCESCCGSGCSACDFDTQTACLKIRDSRLGLLAYSPATWDEDEEEYTNTATCNYDPDKIIINYRAGTVNHEEKYPYLQMDPKWERAIVYYAYTMMDRVSSRSENTHNIWKEMSDDLARVQQDRSYLIDVKDLRNPLGTTRAAVNLWRMIEQSRLV